MEHAYKLLYLLRPVIWGLFVFLIGVYGNRFYKKLLTIISAFLAIISVGGVALSTHLINHALTAYNMGQTKVCLPSLRSFVRAPEPSR